MNDEKNQKILILKEDLAQSRTRISVRIKKFKKVRTTRFSPFRSDFSDTYIVEKDLTTT